MNLLNFKNNKIVGFVSIIVVMMFLFSAIIAFASTGGGEHAGDHGEGHVASKRWDYNLSTGEHDYTDTFRVMNFAVLAIALFFLLKKPVSQFLGDRIQNIQQQLEELESQKSAAEKKLAQYNEQLSTLSSESEKIIEQYRQQGLALKKKILEEADTAAEKLQEQALRTIDHEFAQARIQLESEVLEKAIAKAEEKIKKSITDQDQDMLVNEYLTKVVTN